jgi:hypothetical protein
MPNTFQKIASVTVGSGGASSIDFTAIPSTFTDLCLKISVRSNQANNANSIGVSFNGSSANFTSKFIEGSGSSAASFNSTSNIGNVQGTSSTSSTFSSVDLYIPNYTGSTNKSYSTDGVTENNGTTAYATLAAGLWSQTAAITSVSITITSFVQYSTATLYGIKKD